MLALRWKCYLSWSISWRTRWRGQLRSWISRKRCG